MGFAPEALSRDRFLGGRLQIWQPVAGYRAAIDPVLLAAFVPATPGQRVLDLGCGSGVAALCLAARVPGLDLHGLEIQPDYAELARRNAEANGLTLTVHDGDLRAPPADLRLVGFDQVLANPPFQIAGAATAADDAGRDRAQRGAPATLAGWIAAGLRRLVPGGRITVIERAERLGELLVALQGPAGGIEILPLTPRAGRPAVRVLARARKGSGAPLTLHSPLTLHKGRSHRDDGSGYTPAVDALLRKPMELLPDTR